MSAPDIFRVAPAYSNPEQNQKDKAQIQTDAWLCHDMVYFGHPEKSQEILLNWALHCREVYKSQSWPIFDLMPNESELVMTTKGYSFLWAWWLMRDLDWNKAICLPWFETVYRPCAWDEQQAGKENNRAAWGLLGCVMADLILGKDLRPWYARIDKNMRAAIGNGGILKIEINRTNSGIFYGTWYLAAILKACQLLGHPNIGELQKPLWWLWQYVKHPDTWPYRPASRWPWTWFPKLERLVHPTSNTLDLPRANDEAGALYLAAGKQFGVKEWIDYARRWPADPPFPGVNIYRWS